MNNLITMIVDMWIHIRYELYSDMLMKLTVFLKKTIMLPELMADPDLVVVGTKEADRIIKRFITHGNASRYDKVCIATLLSNYKLVNKYHDLLGVTVEESGAIDPMHSANLAYRLHMI